MNGLLHKTRKPKFELTLQIIDLNNVPLVAGQSFVKWHLPMSTAAEHRGVTAKEPIKDHKVSWNHEKKILLRLSMDKTNLLQECMINLEVIQEYNAGRHSEKITLGKVELNLAEYADPHMEEGEIIVRRHLMQDSKINSTVKIGIGMVQVDGERNFVAPALRSAPVFEGFAGVMASEQQGEPDKVNHMPNMSADQGELQDMYRLALAASWARQVGELPPDKCIEDIFNGGDGWGNNAVPPSINPSLRPQRSQGEAESDDEQTVTGEEPHARPKGSHRSSSGSKEFHHHGERTHSPTLSKQSVASEHRHRRRISYEKARGMREAEHKQPDPPSPMSSSDWGGPTKRNYEIPEWAVREDLRAWKVPVMALEEAGTGPVVSTSVGEGGA